jgi:hypothetical protein
MFYKGQIDEIAASLENEFAKDGLKIASQYNAIWVVLHNGKFGIEVRDGSAVPSPQKLFDASRCLQQERFLLLLSGLLYWCFHGIFRLLIRAHSIIDLQNDVSSCYISKIATIFTHY